MCHCRHRFSSTSVLLLLLLLLLSKSSSSSSEDCFTDTLDLFLAQVQDVQNGNSLAVIEYNLCDNVEINVGFPNDKLNDFINGSFPILLARPNSIITCNGCILKGGFVQLVALPSYITLDAYNQLYDNTTISDYVAIDNVVVDGITFTGTVHGQASILLGAPGNNVAFQNLKFRNLTLVNTTNGGLDVGTSVMHVGANVLVPVMPPNILQVTLRQSTFQNVFYHGHVFVNVDSQVLQVEVNNFDTIVAVTNDYNENDNANANNTSKYSFFACLNNAYCTFASNCLQNVTYVSAFLVQGQNSTFVNDNNYATTTTTIQPVNDQTAICSNDNMYQISSGSCLQPSVTATECVLDFSNTAGTPTSTTTSTTTTSSSSSSLSFFATMSTVFAMIGTLLFWISL